MKNRDYRSGYCPTVNIRVPDKRDVSYLLKTLKDPKSHGRMSHTYRKRIPSKKKKPKAQENKRVSYLANGILIGGLAALVMSSGCIYPFGDSDGPSHDSGTHEKYTVPSKAPGSGNNAVYDPYPDIARAKHKTVEDLEKQIKESKSNYPDDHETTREFGVGNKTHKLKLKLSSKLHEYFANAPQGYENTWNNLEFFVRKLIRDSPGQNATKDKIIEGTYQMLIGDEEDRPFMWEFLSSLSLETDSKDSDDLAMTVAGFVQTSIPYNNSTSLTYPYNTLWERVGDCDRKALLMAECFGELNYTTGLFIYEKAEHAAVGIGAPSGYGNYGTNLCFVEPTSEREIGNTSGRYGFYRNITLDPDPLVVYLKTDGKVLEKLPEILREQEELNKKYGSIYGTSSYKQKPFLERIYELKKQREEVNATINDVLAKVAANNEIIEQMESMNVSSLTQSELDAFNRGVYVINENQTELSGLYAAGVNQYNNLNGQINNTIEEYKCLVIR